jgi:hypothetical protein
MAEVEGFEFHQTATGFKNIGAMGLQLKQQVCSDPTVPSGSALTLLLQLPLTLSESASMLCFWLVPYIPAGQAGTALLRRGNRFQLRRVQL